MTVLPILAGIACTLSLSNKLLQKLVINKNNKYKKQYHKDQQSIKSFDRFNGKSLQDKIIDKNEYESICNIFINYLEETKMTLFKTTNIKIKSNLLSHEKLKINLKPRI